MVNTLHIYHLNIFQIPFTKYFNIHMLHIFLKSFLKQQQQNLYPNIPLYTHTHTHTHMHAHAHMCKHICK